MKPRVRPSPPVPSRLPRWSPVPVVPRRVVGGIAVALGVLTLALARAGANPSGAPAHSPDTLATAFDESLRGLSGQLEARFVAPGDPAIADFTRWLDAGALSRPGVYSVDTPPGARPFAFLALHSFAEKNGGRLGGYHLGDWPGEHGLVRSPADANPAGFIEVTPDNQDFHVSVHFRLRDFLTHDQPAVWPKYLVLQEDLVDKLELVIAALERSGMSVRHMTVMSGFRTPWYNATGGDTTGRDEFSRHMYGGAADVFVDNDQNGWMDDLNADGRIDTRDAEAIIAAMDQVERSHPALIGGGGVYPANAHHGPFAHIDARGDRVRWGPGQ